MGLSAVKLLFSKVTPGLYKRLATHSVGDGCLNDLHALLPEPMFLRALCLERKRAERSRKLFVLMLLEGEKLFPNSDEDNLLNRTVSALFCSIRETDIAGWYKQHAALGVIFAELGAGDKKSILSALDGRITAALRSNLHPDDLNHIQFSFHPFPEDWEDPETGRPTMATLYPDLPSSDYIAHFNAS